MARLRRDTLTSGHNISSPNVSPISPPGISSIPEFNKVLRVVSSGTLFLTHTLYVPHHPDPSSAIRAYAVEKARGGSANTVSSTPSSQETIFTKKGSSYQYSHSFPSRKQYLLLHLGEMRKEDGFWKIWKVKVSILNTARFGQTLVYRLPGFYIQVCIFFFLLSCN